MNYAVIPARGGSKGIPRKNLELVGGVPLVARAIAACNAARNIDQVIVSSDDEEILATAQAWGATPVRRPDELAGDKATSESALLHAIDAVGATDEDNLIFVQCTSPFVTASDVDAICDALADADTAWTVAPSHNFVWGLKDGQVEAIDHDASYRPRRQDREARFVETGAAYGMRIAGFKRHQHRFFGTMALVETDAARALEIDDQHELAIARATAGLLLPASPEKLAKIELLVLDFDGVLTNNKVIVSPSNEEVLCDRGDGMGIAMAKDAGIEILVLSKEQHPVVAARCKKLKIACIHGIDDKPPVLQQLARDRGLTMENVAYMGNDINDLGCLEIAGLPAAPCDAHRQALAKAQYISPYMGGGGAVRDLCEQLVHARQQ